MLHLLVRKGDFVEIREVKERDTIEKRTFIVNVLFVLGPFVLSS